MLLMNCSCRRNHWPLGYTNCVILQTYIVGDRGYALQTSTILFHVNWIFGKLKACSMSWKVRKHVLKCSGNVSSDFFKDTMLRFLLKNNTIMYTLLLLYFSYIYIYIYIAVHHVPKCMNCYKAIVVITGRAHCFHDNTYIYIYIYFIYCIYILYKIYIYIYIYIFIYIDYRYLRKGEKVTPGPTEEAR